MATQLQIVNRVLRRLRESQVSGTTDTEYAGLIAALVADVQEDLLDQWDWDVFRHKVIVDVSDGTAKYDLTRTVSGGGGVRDATDVAKNESILMWTDDMPEAYIFDSDADQDQNSYLMFLSPEAFRMRKNQDRDDTNIDPCYFTLYSEVVSGTPRLYLELYPEPDATRVVELTFWTRPDKLEADGSTDSTPIVLPETIIYNGTLMYAVMERGEEMGEPANVIAARYTNAVAAAIDREADRRARAGAWEWVRN